MKYKTLKLMAMMNSRSCQKYGTSDKNLVRYAFEELHDMDSVNEVIRKNNEAGAYFFKRLIVTHRSEIFKKYFSGVNIDSVKHKDFIKYLMVCSVFSFNASVFIWLAEKFPEIADLKNSWDFVNILDINRNKNIPFKYSQQESKLETFIYDRKITDEMMSISFQVIQNLYSITMFNKDRFMKYFTAKFEPCFFESGREVKIFSIEKAYRLFDRTAN